VSPERIQHSSDREALETLRGTHGLDQLIGFALKHSFEKRDSLINVGSRVRVGPNQLPGLYKVFHDCVSRSGVSPEPELYLEDGLINAFTSGVDHPYIVLQYGAVSALTEKELEFILGHELGHVRFQHVLYETLARVFPPFLESLPLGGILAAGLNAALDNWSRKAELSCDRMGLLIC